MTGQFLPITIRVIVDTHILVYREFDGDIPNQYQNFFSCINKLRIPILVHPLSLQEIAEDANFKSKGIILSKAKTYPQLDSPPDATMDDQFQKLLKISSSSRDCSDNQLLYCVYKNVVDCFITEDREIQKKAKNLGIADKVLSIKEAINFFNKKMEIDIKSRIHASKQIFSFFNDGDYWKIGERGKENLFKEISGFRFISFLLHYPNKSFSAFEVYNDGKTFSKVFEVEVAFEDSLRSEDDVLKLVTKDGKISSTKVNMEILNLENKLESCDFDGPEETITIKEQINILRNYIRNRIQRDHRSQAEKARINVTKGIHNALQKLNHEVPTLGLYLGN